MARWKAMSFATLQRDTVEQYEQLWTKLEQLMPSKHLNWISDQFKALTDDSGENAGFISIEDLQLICSKYIRMLYYVRDIGGGAADEPPSDELALYLQAMDIAHCHTPPIEEEHVYFPLEVAVIITEIFRLLWIIQDKHAGWPEMEAMQMRSYYDKLDRGRKEQMKNREMFNLLALIGEL